MNSYKSKREWLDVGGYVSEDTEQMRHQIEVMDELFLTEQETKPTEEDES